MSTHSNLSMSLLVKYSRVFNDGDERSPREILAPYGKTLTLKMIGVLNSMLQRRINELSEQVVSWFGPEGMLGTEMMHKIIAGYRAEINMGMKLRLISSYTNLRMNITAMELDEVADDSAIDIDESHLNFFIAYLKLNEEFLYKQEGIASTIPAEFTGLQRASWMSTATLLSYHDFSQIDQVVGAVQMIKAMYCMEFIEKYNQQLHQLYLESKGVQDFKEYAKKMFPLSILCFTPAVSINGQDEENQKFLELFNLQATIPESEENAVKFDFLAVRNRPLYSVGNNEYVMLNRAMIIGKMYSSVYWDCKSILATHPEIGISADKFRTDFTTDFSEGYLVYKMFDKAYSKRSCINLSGEQMKAQMGNTEPDYYVRNGNKVFLIEVKDSFITGKAKQSFSVKDIQEDLKKKYYKSGNSEKAVKQLVTRIRFSLTKAYPFDQHYKPQSLRFYPILIVYDINLTVPGIESVLNDWFNTERESLIQEMADAGIKGFTINDVVILHIDGLILATEYIEAGKLKLESLIDEHLQRKRRLLKITDGSTIEDIKADVLNSYFSFNEIVMNTVNSIPPKNRIMPSEFSVFKGE
ncbi:hypothetical protein [Pedobacter endophyticus]|uniref:Uncharacterized protein n=1 Tax=Pedobacter endophyticus TaxID=2789740 RepID=A0A7U3Q3F1_9SPHI|nr:hypothetical protein [Pedobacter endophyticus]QPH37855.1 hypothetical protein IZT61_12110 [Pedobacter endophyticus]